MNKNPVHNPVLCLVREEAIRKVLKSCPEMKKYIKMASKKQIKKWKDEVDDSEPYGA